MSPADIVILAVIALTVGIIIFRMVRNHKKGKSSCGCGCDSCHHNDSCNL